MLRRRFIAQPIARRNAPGGSTRNTSNEIWDGSPGAGSSTTFGFIATSTSANSVPAMSHPQA